jgi:ankyrin repeat protein
MVFFGYWLRLLGGSLWDGPGAADGRLACCFQVLLSRKLGDLHAVAINGDTALHTAARNGQVFVAALLLLGGLDANCLNGEGKTPLQLAVECRHPATVQILSATSPQLQQLSKALGSPPNFPLEPSANIHPMHSPCIDWSDLGSVLSRMWHATHNGMHPAWVWFGTLGGGGLN